MSTTAPSAPADAARKLLEAGIAASQNNDSTEALALFAQAGAAAPGWALPHFLLGSEYASMGQWEQAESELANAVLLAPDLHVARYQLGLLQFSSGRAAAALVTWQPLAGLVEQPSLSDFVQGFAALARDAFDEARELFQRGLAHPGVNQAMAGDIQRVLDQLPEQPDHEQAPSATASENLSHVLVANYDKFNLH